jgi:hypothetical protein
MYYLGTTREGKSLILDSTTDDIRMISDGGILTSRSPGFDTLEKLYLEEGILNDPCKICDSVVGTDYIEPVKSELREKNICFTCHFWLEKVALKDDPRVARIDHVHYMIFPPKTNGFRGFGGRMFTIQFEHITVRTSNLWYQGEIPEHFWDQLPDNAKFV